MNKDFDFSNIATPATIKMFGLFQKFIVINDLQFLANYPVKHYERIRMDKAKAENSYEEYGPILVSVLGFARNHECF